MGAAKEHAGMALPLPGESAIYSTFMTGIALNSMPDGHLLTIQIKNICKINDL